VLSITRGHVPVSIVTDCQRCSRLDAIQSIQLPSTCPWRKKVLLLLSVAPTPRGTGGARAPHFYRWLGTGDTVSRRTANKKLTKLYWPSRMRSPFERLIVLLEPKKVEGHDQKKIFRRFAPDRCHLLSSSFRRHWLLSHTSHRHLCLLAAVLTVRRQHCLPTAGPLIGSSTVTPSSAVRDLGVYIDSGLTMQSHVRQTVSRFFAVLRQLRTVRRQVPTSMFQSLIFALVLFRLDYCNSVLFGLPASLIQRLQSVQNAAVRLIFRSWRSERITPALITLHWCIRERTRDEWRHRRLTSLACSVARSPSLVRWHILFIAPWDLRITAAVYFPVIKHYIRYGNSVLARVYSICRQSVVQCVA